jgi:hypothetical protein
VHTATPLITVDAASASPAAYYLVVSGPICYETPVGSLVCLGRVRNLLNQPVEQVTVEVQLLARDGIPLATAHATVARMLLPAGEAGPYRVLFEHIPDNYAGTFAFPESAKLASSPERYADLTLHQATGEFANGQYEARLVVQNESYLAAEHVTVTVTLFDIDNRVTGYRQIALEDDLRLQPGESLSLAVKVIPQGPGTVNFEAFAEGLLNPN